MKLTELSVLHRDLTIQSARNVPADDVSVPQGSPANKNETISEQSHVINQSYSDDLNAIVGDFENFRALATSEALAPALNQLIQQSNQQPREFLEKL